MLTYERDRLTRKQLQTARNLPKRVHHQPILNHVLAGLLSLSPGESLRVESDDR